MCYRAVCCELFKLVFILGSLSREFSRLIALHSSRGQVHSSRLQVTANLNLAALRF